MEKNNERIPIKHLEWPTDKDLSYFLSYSDVLADNLINEGQDSRASCVKYLIKRVKIAEKANQYKDGFIVEQDLKIKKIEESNTEMLEWLIDYRKYSGGVKDIMAVDSIIEKATGQKIEEVLKDE